MKYLSLSFLLLIGFNFFIWDSILTSISENEDLKIYFLDVGQGDSELIVLPGGVKILIDGGPSKEASFELGEVLSPTDRYIDVIAMTHAQKDHFGGLADVVSRYQVGAFVWNGEGALSDEWLEFEKILLEHDIPTVVLGVGDRIINNEEEVIVLAPNKDLIKESNANEGSLVLKLKSEDVSALFTGDISIETENKILEGQDL
ncbi:MAG: MBL fold metallo-hydrolase, partial [Patescibacteria group bacterium]